MRDDVGDCLTVERPVRGVVSLVPSLAEAIAVTRRDALIGATKWCSLPADLDVARVRGTTNPDLRAIASLRPDLVIANREENREIGVRRLWGRGIQVWVTVCESVAEAFASLLRLFVDALGWTMPAWLPAAGELWSAPPPYPMRYAATLIWRDPWMAIGRRTFADHVLARLGFANSFGDSLERYPGVAPQQVIARRPDVVVLPDEPYPFTASDGPEAFPGIRTAVIPGRQLTCYGPSLLNARTALHQMLT